MSVLLRMNTAPRLTNPQCSSSRAETIERRNHRQEAAGTHRGDLVDRMAGEIVGASNIGAGGHDRTARERDHHQSWQGAGVSERLALGNSAAPHAVEMPRMSAIVTRSEAHGTSVRHDSAIRTLSTFDVSRAAFSRMSAISDAVYAMYTPQEYHAR